MCNKYVVHTRTCTLYKHTHTKIAARVRRFSTALQRHVFNVFVGMRVYIIIKKAVPIKTHLFSGEINFLNNVFNSRVIKSYHLI